MASWFTTLFNWLNPFSDSFFLKVAFVPSDGYMDSKNAQLQSQMNDKFGWFNDLKTQISSMKLADSTGGLQNIHVTIPIVNQDVTIIDFSYLDDHASFIRGITSALVYFFIAMYLIRQGPKILGS